MKRPLTVTLICGLFIAAGISGIVYHSSDWMEIGIQGDTILALVIRLAAIVGGIFALKGSNVARWFLVGWILYHVVLSFFHTTSELVTHLLVAVVVLVTMFNRKANMFFKRK